MSHYFPSYSNCTIICSRSFISSLSLPVSFPTLVFSSLGILFIWHTQLQKYCGNWDSFQDTMHAWYEGKVLTAFCKYCHSNLTLLFFHCPAWVIMRLSFIVTCMKIHAYMRYFMHVHVHVHVQLRLCLFSVRLYLCVHSIGRKRVGPQRLWKEQGRSAEEKAWPLPVDHYINCPNHGAQ